MNLSRTFRTTLAASAGVLWSAAQARPTSWSPPTGWRRTSPTPKVRVIEVSVEPGLFERGHIPARRTSSGTPIWSTRCSATSPRRRNSRSCCASSASTRTPRSSSTATTTTGSPPGAPGCSTVYGLDDNVKLLDGGRKKWERRSAPLDNRVDAVQAEQHHGRGRRTPSCARGSPTCSTWSNKKSNATIVDIRSPDEYSGKIFAPPGLAGAVGPRRPRSRRASTCPGAARSTEDGTFKSADELKKLYADAGIDGSKPIIVYCRIGERSSHTWFVLSQDPRLRRAQLRRLVDRVRQLGRRAGRQPRRHGLGRASNADSRPAGEPARVARARPRAPVDRAASSRRRPGRPAVAPRPSPLPLGARRPRSACCYGSGDGAGRSRCRIAVRRGASASSCSARASASSACSATGSTSAIRAACSAILLALAVGMAGYARRLRRLAAGCRRADGCRPTRFIGPVSLVLVAAGLAFGAGMAISGSCVSAHLYRLGEGSPTAPFALIGTAIGFGARLPDLERALHCASSPTAPVVWLPRHAGLCRHAGCRLRRARRSSPPSLLRWRSPRRPSQPDSDERRCIRVFVERWPAWVGGLADRRPRRPSPICASRRSASPPRSARARARRRRRSASCPRGSKASTRCAAASIAVERRAAHAERRCS